MRDYVSLGPVPSEESCAQVGTENYHDHARAECRRYIELIRTVCGAEPEGALLAVKSFPHDFGSYMETVCYFDGDDEAAVTYAYRVEKDAPTEWPV